MALQLLRAVNVPQDLEQFLKEVFGEPLSRLSSFSNEQMQRLNAKLHDLAKEAVRDEFAKLHTEIADLKARVARLETERAQTAAETGAI